MWAFPPAELVGEVLGKVAAAFQRQPQGTRATVVIPNWPERTWFRELVTARGSPYRHIRTLRVGQRLCEWASGRLAEPCPYDLLVLGVPQVTSRGGGMEGGRQADAWLRHFS
jgi:hypothetical protein